MTIDRSQRLRTESPARAVEQPAPGPAAPQSATESWLAARELLEHHRARRTMLRRRQTLAVALALAMPLVLYGVLQAVPALAATFAAPAPHFWIVSATSLLALLLALAVGAVAVPCRDPRVAYLALGLMSIAGIFAVHGLTTPGVLYGFNAAVGVTAHLSMLVGSFFFALSAQASDGPLDRFVRLRFRSTIAVGGTVLATFVAASLVWPDWLGFLALTKPPIVYASLATTVGMFVFAGLRYATSYRLAPVGFTAAVAVAAVLLAEADVMLVFSDVWSATWWGYHVAMLSGFLLVTAAALIQYRRPGGLSWAIQGMYRLHSIVEHELDRDGAVAMVAVAIERKDGYTAGHTMRVAEIAVRIGHTLSLPPERLRLLARAGVLHDVGKIWVADEILNKPGRLTEAEFDVIKQHPLLGHDLLRRTGALDEEIAIIATHHERMDGTGYPYGLPADEILLEARIIAVADVYDSLATDRPQRRAFPRADVHRILQDAAGPHLDPGLVEVWLAIAEDYDGLVAAVDTRGSLRSHAGQRADRPIPV